MSKHALIIEDNVKNVNVLAHLLTAQGFEYSQITDLRNLKQTLSTLGKVDIVFLDLEMPVMTGFQTLEILRAQEGFQDVPIIAHTVHVSEISVAHQHGFDGFIAKPLDSERFPKQLARILNGENVWEAS